MDSRHPNLIDDPRTAEEGGTNADDIDNVLARLDGLELKPRIKELTFPDWMRDAEIRRMRPDLLIIHGSAFYRHTSGDEEGRLVSFLKALAPRTRVLIYTRGAPSVPALEARVPALAGRIRTFPLPRGRATFRDAVTAREFGEVVRAMLAEG
jgi:hypothetical protein